MNEINEVHEHLSATVMLCFGNCNNKLAAGKQWQ